MKDAIFLIFELLTAIARFLATLAYNSATFFSNSAFSALVLPNDFCSTAAACHCRAHDCAYVECPLIRGKNNYNAATRVVVEPVAELQISD